MTIGPTTSTTLRTLDSPVHRGPSEHMRAEQYLRHLDVVTDYIYAHLDEDLSLETLAHVSGFSRYHWHRIYRAVRGETAAQAVRRLRLERAAAMLTETSWSIERIAWKAGFTGTEIFSRAFLRSYGTTPGRFRTGGRPASIDSPVTRCGSGSTSSVREDPGWAVRVETRCGYRLAVSEHRGSYMDIGRAFSRVKDRMGAGNSMVAIYEDDPDAVPPADLRSAAGTVVDPGTKIPHDLTERMVPAAGTRSCATSARTLRCTMPTGGSTVGGCRARVRSRETIRSSRSTSPTRRLPRLSTLSPISSCPLL